MMKRQKCAVAEFSKLNVFNDSLKLQLNFPWKTFEFRHSAAAHFYRSRGTLMCHGTQVGKHWPIGFAYDKSIIYRTILEKIIRSFISKSFVLYITLAHWLWLSISQCCI